MKSHDKGKGNGNTDSKPAKTAQPAQRAAEKQPPQAKTVSYSGCSFVSGVFW